VDLARFNPSFEASEFRRSRSIPEHVPLIGTVANLNPVKGVDVFVRCAAMLSRQAPEARFVVAGAGPLEEELARLRNELGLDDRLIFAGSLEDVRPLLASLDVFMLLSRSEGMSNALLEAMATAKPIVATRVGGNAEAIGEGEAGFLVPSENPEAAANAALRLIRDGRLAGRLGLAARRRAELSFSLQRMVERTQNLYTGLLARSRRRGRECLAASARRDFCGAAMFHLTGDETGK
jgi:glycosyltransferase involved in cell wall biosynthesis